MNLRSDGAFHVPAKNHMTIEEAQERGRRSFEAGTQCAPFYDSGFSIEACAAELPTSDLLAAWHRGWTLANLAAPLDVCLDFHRGEKPHADCGGPLETCDDGEIRCDAHADSYEYNRESSV